MFLFSFLFILNCCCSRKCSNIIVLFESEKKSGREDGCDNVFTINVKNTPLRTRAGKKCVCAQLPVEVFRGISIFVALREVFGYIDTVVFTIHYDESIRLTIICICFTTGFSGHLIQPWTKYVNKKDSL